MDEASIDRFLTMVDDPYNCLTLCSGSLNANEKNHVAEIVYKHCDRIAFAHIRNVKHFPNGDFSEASHRDCDGDTGILDIVKAYHDCGFEGYIRPDHGRHLWNEGPGNIRPGYGLYDREKVKEATMENPFWIHFGAGNIFRAYQARVVQELLNAGALDRGLVVAEGFDYEIIEK